ncbi:MAG: hypothetical protein AAF907_04195 [Planctomycetota bacterium]
MTLFGKILIGLMLALSLVFASLAAAVYSADRDYRAALEREQAKFQNERQEKEDLQASLRAEIGDLNASLAEQKEDLDKQIRAVQLLTQEKKLLQEEVSSTQTALDVQTALARIAQEDSEDRRTEVLAGRERNADLSQKFVDSEAEIAGLVDENFNKDVSITQMAQTNARLLDQVGSLRAQLRSLGIEPQLSFAAAAPAPDVAGKVLEFDERGSAGTKVLISLGSDDGLRVGDKLQVVRMEGGGKYVGQIQLTEVEYDQAIGTLTSKSRTTSIKKGDDVKTRL